MTYCVCNSIMNWITKEGIFMMSKLIFESLA